MLTLNNLRPTRTSKDVTRPALERLTGIFARRISTLEKGHSEPWFDEAVLLARCLCTAGVGDLVSSGILTVSDYGQPTARDVEIWRSGVRVPLSLAYRVADWYNLPSVDDLTATGLTRQIWEIVGSGDRHPTAAGFCPWCVADVAMGEPHLLTCLPNNLWTADKPPPEDGVAPATLLPQSRERPPSLAAHGMRVLRDAAGSTQAEVAAVLGINTNYYSRLERGVAPLSIIHADKLAMHYAVPRAVVYARPTYADEVTA